MRNTSIHTAFLLLIAAYSVQAQYTFVGNTTPLGNDCYQITPNQIWQNGALWYNDEVDLNEPFHLQFQASFGNDPNGADGMVFVMQQVSNSVLGIDGEGMGFSGFAPSFGVEFDTYQNASQNDPVFDHVAFLQNGTVNHSSPNNLAGPVQISPINPNVCDGMDHVIDIFWNPTINEFSVWFDCTPRLTAIVNLTGTIFQSNPNVFWGFTGATGGLSNQQKICVDPNILGVPEAYQICQGEGVQLQASGTSMGVYSWEPMDGLSNGNINNPIASPQETTTYTVTFTDLCQNSQNQTTTVVVNNPSVELGPDVNACEGEPITLNALNPSGDISWSTGQTGLSIQVTESGTYSAIATEGNCQWVDDINVGFSDLPTISLPASAAFCEGDSYTVTLPQNGYTYIWNDNSTEATRTFTESGNYTVAAMLGNCTAAASIAITTTPLPEFELGSDMEACEGSTVLLMANIVNAAVVWNTGQATQGITTDVSGLFWATASNSGCSFSDTVSVIFIPIPELTISGETSFCEGESVELLAIGADSYIWSNGETGNTISVGQSGTYVVTGIDPESGCVGNASIAITRKLLPRIIMPSSASKCEGQSLTVMAETPAAGSFTWNTGLEGNFISVQEPGMYTATLINTCGEASASIEITDRDCSSDLFIPSAFTPDGDGLNELFKAISQNATEFSMRIFNRAGELVFHTADLDKGWNGSFMNNGYFCPAGVYVVHYTAAYGNFEITEGTGSVTLIR